MTFSLFWVTSLAVLLIWLTHKQKPKAFVGCLPNSIPLHSSFSYSWIRNVLAFVWAVSNGMIGLGVAQLAPIDPFSSLVVKFQCEAWKLLTFHLNCDERKLTIYKSDTTRKSKRSNPSAANPPLISDYIYYSIRTTFIVLNYVFLLLVVPVASLELPRPLSKVLMLTRRLETTNNHRWWVSSTSSSNI